MESTNLGLQMPKTKLAPTYVKHEAAELLSILLVDVASDIEVAARDAGISDASFIRCRRALDRLSCAQSILEAMRAESAGAAGEADAVMGEAMRETATRRAVELLARGGPEDYPAGRWSGCCRSLAERSERFSEPLWQLVTPSG